MFKFYLDNQLVSDPINWADFEENIVRDDIVKGLFPKYEIKLNFNGNGFAYLYEQKRVYGFCKIVQLRIDMKCSSGNYDAYFNGYIFISDVDFNRGTCIAECPVIDDNYAARIFNNKAIKTYLDTGKSKSGSDIPAATYYDIQVFSPQDAGYLADTRRLIFLYDAFKFLVDFMTDGRVGFESEYLDYNVLKNDLLH